MTALAEAELDVKRPAAAEAAADAALKVDSQNGRAQLWKGLAMLRTLTAADDKPKWTNARSWVVKANRSNPEDPLPLIVFFQSYSLERMVAPAIALDGLAKAIELVPQDQATRLTYAMAMAQKKKYAEAIAAIRPVAYDPHSSSATFARTLITRFEKARDTGALVDEVDGKDEPEAK
jgi:tetratricopeptide (TPR) repeat protein